MKILYNLHSSGALKTGIGHYAQHILSRILHCPEVEEVVGIKGRAILTRKDLVNLGLAVQAKDITASKQFIKDLIPILRSLPGAYRTRMIFQNLLSRSIYKGFAKKDFIYHETNFIPQPYTGKLVVTIHDLSHIHYPEYHPKERVNYLNHYLPGVLQRADKIIAVSEFTRQQILNTYNISGDKVISILHGVDEEFKPRQEVVIKETLKKYNIRYQQYLLSVCTLEPRKNLARVLKAFSRLPAAIRKQYPIVLVGMKGWKNKGLLSLAEPLLKAGELILPGYLQQEELYHIYSGAKIFIYPSLYEGFGLPILEAMASGVPVITANTSSLPEVSDGAAIEVNPLSVNEISLSLMTLLEDMEASKACITKGLARAQTLTWDRCIANTLQVYRSLS